MDLKITSLNDANPTGGIQMVTAGAEVGLYTQSFGKVTPSQEPFYDYELKLSAVPVLGKNTGAFPPTSIPLPLPVPPSWEIVLNTDGTANVTYTVFQGGWNAVDLDSLNDGKRELVFGYGVEATDSPHFVQNTGKGDAKQQYISAILSGYLFGIIGLQEQDGEQVPAVSDITGTSEKQVSVGRAFGDLSVEPLKSVTAVYLEHKNVGPLAPSGAFCGPLALADYTIQGNKLDTPMALVDGVEFCDFDIAVAGDNFCLLAITGDGAPLLALFDKTGKISGTPDMPVGSWSNAGHWAASPTIVATPGDNAGFSFAFIEMDGDTPKSIQTGTATTAPST